MDLEKDGCRDMKDGTCTEFLDCPVETIYFLSGIA